MKFELDEEERALVARNTQVGREEAVRHYNYRTGTGLQDSRKALELYDMGCTWHELEPIQMLRRIVHLERELTRKKK